MGLGNLYHLEVIKNTLVLGGEYFPLQVVDIEAKKSYCVGNRPPR